MRNIEGVAFYADPAWSRPDPQRLAADRAVQAGMNTWLDVVQGAAARRRAGERRAAACALSTLDNWAKGGALLGGTNLQGSYHRVWTLAGAALAFLAIRDAEGLDPVSAGRVGRWLGQVAEAVRPRYDRSSQARISDALNNQAAWAGLAVAAAGIAANKRELFDWGLDKLRQQLAQVTAEGALPQEAARGALALHYHLFALAPIAALERLAAANRVSLAPPEAEALARLTRFIFAATQDPSRIAALAGVPQQDFWLEDRPVLSAAAGLELRAQAAADSALDAALAPFRPLRDRWLGGEVTGRWGDPAAPAPPLDAAAASPEGPAAATPGRAGSEGPATGTGAAVTPTVPNTATSAAPAAATSAIPSTVIAAAGAAAAAAVAASPTGVLAAVAVPALPSRRGAPPASPASGSAAPTAPAPRGPAPEGAAATDARPASRSASFGPPAPRSPARPTGQDSAPRAAAAGRATAPAPSRTSGPERRSGTPAARAAATPPGRADTPAPRPTAGGSGRDAAARNVPASAGRPTRPEPPRVRDAAATRRGAAAPSSAPPRSAR
ncbi:alginate lyase family protein [Roseomonas sp. BN140053]|uniref:alginate lyase family protein n=1 Tax=Roseomonas sp. BN140053 TaxID=3391898 RepID=UPI0039EC878A